MKNNRVYNVFEVFYRRDGKKRSVFCMNRDGANKMRSNLVANRRKFLGMREVTLVEMPNNTVEV